MAGHSQFANIKHRKGAQDTKRAKIFTKVLRKVLVSAKGGGPDPAMNPALRDAIQEAKSLNVPKDRIEAAINKSAGNNSENYEEIRYEGYATGGIAVIVEVLSDNRNRSASDVRSTFTKYGGSMGESGSVTFSFDRLGLIEYDLSIGSEDEIFESSIEAGASFFETNDESYFIFCKIDDLKEARNILTTKYGEPAKVRLTWKAKNKIAVSEEAKETLIKMIEAFEDFDDVQYVETNADIEFE